MIENITKKLKINIDQKSLLYFLIYGGIIAIFVLLAIVPSYISTNHRKDEIKQLKAQIEEQKQLAPVYATLLDTAKNKRAFAFPNPEKTAIPRKESGKFQEEFKAMAVKSGLIVVSVAPDLSASAGSATSLLHNVVLRGEFASLRKMLVGLGALSYLDRIEEIGIKQYPDSMEFKMKIWIAFK
jgi:hypothetical protein